jgi:hypothetical protein
MFKIWFSGWCDLIMNKDDIEIIHLYENSTYILFSEGLDYLNLESINDFDWELFEERYSYAKLHLNEKFEYDGEKDLGNDQKEFLYTITTPDNSSYHVKLNLYPNHNKIMDTALLVSRSNNTDKEGLYKELLNVVKNHKNKYQLYISFYDSENNYKLTNKNKSTNESFIVFKSLENALNHFMYILNYKEMINVIKFYVDKNEIKRIKLYKRIMNNFSFKFNNYLEDNITDSRYILLTLF